MFSQTVFPSHLTELRIKYNYHIQPIADHRRWTWKSQNSSASRKSLVPICGSF